MAREGIRLRIRRQQKAERIIPLGTVPFSEVAINQRFFLTPKDTVRVLWIKVCKWGGQYQNWSNDSSYPDQSFPQDYPVFLT